MKEEERRIVDALTPLLHQEGYEVAEVRLSGTKTKTLSVIVDRVDPISLEDIVLVSQKVSDCLDQIDPIDGAYTLDVSSLGAEKPIALSKLGEYVGRYVNLHLSHPYQGENILEGSLLEVTEEEVTLQMKKKTAKVQAKLPRASVDKARLAIEL